MEILIRGTDRLFIASKATAEPVKHLRPQKHNDASRPSFSAMTPTL